jgi:hypothetical protein
VNLWRLSPGVVAGRSPMSTKRAIIPGDERSSAQEVRKTLGRRSRVHEFMTFNAFKKTKSPKALLIS